MSETKSSSCKSYRGFLWLIVLAVFVYLIVRNIGVWANVLKVLLGFGSVILVHEFGHFLVAKLSGIKVEVFSIFMPPTLLGVQRTEDGLRFRVLPKLVTKDKEEGAGKKDAEEPAEKEKKAEAGTEPEAEVEAKAKSQAKAKPEEPQDESLLSFTIGKGGKAWETEYRIGLIPLGGFVKMLGQEDVGTVKSTGDPRSFANKSVGTRAAVLTAGVAFNVISAVIIFMIVFLVGIELPPPVIGEVEPNSPAARAGWVVGDEVIEIAGKSKDLDFSHIGMAAALSDVNEAVPVKIRHENGKEEEYRIVAEESETSMGKMRRFGVMQAYNLTVEEVSDANSLRERTGLQSGDVIKSIDGEHVQTHWEFVQLVENAVSRSVSISAERTEGAELIETQIGLEWLFAEGYEIESESELYHIYSMVPRLRITAAGKVAMPKGRPERMKDWIKGILSFGRASGQEDVEDGPVLEAGDIILAIGGVENPTYREVREVTEAHKDKELPVKVLRADANGVEERLVVTVTPRRPKGSERVLIGIAVVLDAEHTVVAKTIDTGDGPAKLGIPGGATIVAVDGAPVSSFYDVADEIRKYKDERITIDYRVDEQVAGSVALNVGGGDGESITVKSVLSEYVPFKNLERLYRAGGPVEAVVMGGRRTVMFITQTYVTLKRLVGRSVSPKNLIGPVGILSVTYRIAKDRPVIYIFYFLGLISAVIAVFNFLPVPPLDGGLIALLIIERIKGSALSERVQTVIAYVGWIAIGTLFLYVTFNDIYRTLFG